MWKRTAETDRKEAIEEGRAEGERLNNLENARKMKEKGISISDITGLSIQEIESLETT